MRRADHGEPFPGFWSAVLLTLVAWMTALVWWVLTSRWIGAQLAGAVGVVVGPGLVAALAAGQVASPRAERLGLRAPSARFVLAGLLLSPAIVIVMEVQGAVWALSGAAHVPLLYEWEVLVATGSAAALISTLVLFVVLPPVAGELVFRGLLHQGLVGRFGAVRGVLLCSALYAVALPAPRTLSASGISLAVGAFLLGLLLGLVRARSGSLLPPVLLHAGMNLIWVLAYAGARSAPGWAPAASVGPLDLRLLVPSVVSVAVGLPLVLRSGGARKAR